MKPNSESASLPNSESALKRPRNTNTTSDDDGDDVDVE